MSSLSTPRLHIYLLLFAGLSALLFLAQQEWQVVSAGQASSFTCTNVVGVPASECQALVDLYTQTNGPAWTKQTGWLTGAISPCFWHGVTCEHGHVTQLDLYGNNVNGTLPASLANLTQLRQLTLNQNQLQGSIPPALGALTNLTGLSMHGNQLSGAIPPELGNLSSLIHLGMSYNQLSGAIPAELENLANLTLLDLTANRLSGTIPSELGNLSQLTYLYLAHNDLSGTVPAALGQLSQLRELTLHNNQGSIWIARIYYPNRRCHLWCSNLYSAPDPCNP
jgi:hypothetical protein